MIISAIFFISFQLDLKGYFRTRGKLLGNISLVEMQGLDPIFTYFDSRAMLKTSLGTENLKLNARFDIADNVVWGFNQRGAPDSPLAENISFNDVVGQEIPPIKLKRLYIQGLTKIGLFMIGFVPSHWGLGMSVNSGDEIYDDFGDTFARILFATKPLGKDSNLITALFFDKAVEGGVTQEGSSDIIDADTDDFGLAILYDTEKIKAGAYTTLRTQYLSNSRAFFTSIYSEFELGKFYFAEEVAGLFGSFSPYKDQTINVNSVGAVARAGYKISKMIFPIVEFGFTSPPGDNEFDFDTNRRGTEFKGFAFDPNYRPAVVLFQFVGGKKFTQLSQKGFTNVIESRRVWSSWYAKFSLNLKSTSFVAIPSFILAWNTKSGKFLGFEPDLEVRNLLLKEKGENVNHSLFVSVRLGYLFATEALKEMERPGERGTKKSNPFALIGLIAYEF